MIEIKTLEDATDLDRPSRVMKYVLVYCSTGSLIILIDGKNSNSKPVAIFLNSHSTPDATYPYHNHPGGEEIFVLDGEVVIEGVTI